MFEIKALNADCRPGLPQLDSPTETKPVMPDDLADRYGREIGCRLRIGHFAAATAIIDRIGKEHDEESRRVNPDALLVTEVGLSP